MKVVDAVADALIESNATDAFGLVGGSNFVITDALVTRGVRFVAARHEGGAVSMADGFSRLSESVPLVSVNIGNGLTNALTALTEAAKSHTPMMLLVPDAHTGRRATTPAWADLAALAGAAGAEFHTITTPGTAVVEATAAYRRARVDGATVVLALPQDILGADAPPTGRTTPTAAVPGPAPSAGAVGELVALLNQAERPVVLAGRGARGHSDVLSALAERWGALVVTSIAARGMFASDPWDLDVAGGFSTQVTADLVAAADLVVAWGASLNPWTLRHGALIGDEAVLVQVDRDRAALGRVPRVDLTILGDVGETANAVLAVAPERPCPGYRTEETADRLAHGSKWRDVPYETVQEPGVMDPRPLTLELDRMLPDERLIVTDIGNFSTYPGLFPRVPDERGILVPIGFGCLGLGLATAIGASYAEPDRQTVACLGDGGFLMSVVELETAVREKRPILIVVYDDSAYGAESQQFGPLGYDTATVTFPDTDLAAIARGYGCEAITARDVSDLEPIAEWLNGPRQRPLLVDAKIASFPAFLMAHVQRVSHASH